MYMFNNVPPPPCPWANRQVYMNGPPPNHPPPANNGYHPPLPYHMMPPQHFNQWQGPGPSRMRGRGYRRGRGSNNHGNSRNENVHIEPSKDMCCQCGEHLQNSRELGVHLCNGGVVEEARPDLPHGDDLDPVSPDNQQQEEELDARLEKLLESLKDFVRNKYDSVTEALEGYVSEKIEEINTLHKENTAEKASLEKMRSEMKEKAEHLLTQEKELKEKQKKLSKDQDSFKREMKKEREEVCRQWQQLRDEISRMEETHKMQRGRVKLDVGGHVFTTSLLTLTREGDSMLAAMFSGRHELLKEDDGCVFIDRDGTHFRYVLNYLRDGGVSMDSLPRDRQLLKELKKEATYYQLHGLMQQIEKFLY